MDYFGDEDFVRVFICKEDLVGGAVRHRFDMYIVTVVTIHNKHVIFSCGRLVRKMACLVREYLAGGGNSRGVDGVCLYVRW